MRVAPPRVLLVTLLLSVPSYAYEGAFLAVEGAAWNIEAGPLEYVLEPSGSDDISDGSDLQAVRDAFRAWECVEGTSLRFVEGQGPGPATIDLDDGKNTTFWDETGEFGLGPGTLGVTVGDIGGSRTAADIVFNGADSAWSTDDGPSAVDIGSVAAHEIGHFVGLDHPCDREGGVEVNCNGPERSIMTPVWGGGLEREPRSDDAEGVVALYPAADPNGRCDGPRVRGQSCICSDECVAGLVCAAAPGEESVCVETCASDASDCGNGFACVLSPPAGDEPASGTCVKNDAVKPAGAVCAAGGECASGTCALLFEVQRSVCQEACSSTSDCTNGVCFEGFCLGGVDVVACPEETAEGCSCSASVGERTRAEAPAALVLPAALVWFLRRRRSRRT